MNDISHLAGRPQGHFIGRKWTKARVEPGTSGRREERASHVQLHGLRAGQNVRHRPRANTKSNEKLRQPRNALNP